MQSRSSPSPLIKEERFTGYAWVIWLVAAVFFAYELFLRLSPTVMVDELMEAFNVHARELGSLSAMYYYAYALMQIPVGILLDRFGPRILLTFASTLVAIGCLVFGTTHQLWVADIGRILMGIGSAFAFVGCLKLSAAWFPASRFAFVVGLTNTLGVLGAVSVAKPMAFMVQNLGWRDVILLMMFIGFGLALLNFLVVRNNPYYQQIASKQPRLPKGHELWTHLKHIVSNKQTWLIALYGGLLVAPIAGFAELWCVPFLMKTYALTKPDAAGLTALIFVGIAVGGPLHGFLSNWIGRRRPIMLAGALGACMSLSTLIYLPELLQPWMIPTSLFLLGFFSVTMLLCFALNSEIHPKEISGTVIAFTNMLVMLGGTLFQPLIGYLLDAHWKTVIKEGAYHYSIHDYQMAFVLLPICQLLGVVLLYFIRETYCHCCDDPTPCKSRK
ncbi:MAG: hypothetical protein K0R12_278 [Gammaproteobacteria bacterium]|jgi:sugar phosphate permease|nr:hypothetical protein [Gammaproteobacteria bacterium]